MPKFSKWDYQPKTDDFGTAVATSMRNNAKKLGFDWGMFGVACFY